MTAQPARRRVKAAALALAGVAMLATTACAAASAATSGKSAESAGQQSSSVPIVVNCGGQTLRRPNIYILECADGYALVGGLTWSTWGSSSALASGTSHFNDCTPNCLSGRGHTFPALVVLWGARAWHVAASQDQPDALGDATPALLAAYAADPDAFAQVWPNTPRSPDSPR
jgi:hypothetical protein